MHVSEIRVKRIRVSQGLGVFQRYMNEVPCQLFQNSKIVNQTRDYKDFSEIREEAGPEFKRALACHYWHLSYTFSTM